MIVGAKEEEGKRRGETRLGLEMVADACRTRLRGVRYSEGRAGPGYITAKNARWCGALGEGRKSWTVLFNEDTLGGKGMLRNSVPVKRKGKEWDFSDV